MKQRVTFTLSETAVWCLEELTKLSSKNTGRVNKSAEVEYIIRRAYDKATNVETKHNG